MSDSTNLMLTSAVMVENLAEKVDKGPLDKGHYVLFGSSCYMKYSSGVSTIQGFLSQRRNGWNLQS